MARTRAEIKTSVVSNTGFAGKDATLNSLCDDALKVALFKHSFVEATKERTWAITESAVQVQIQGTGGDDDDSDNFKVTDILSARIIDTDADGFCRLTLKNRIWFSKNFPSPEDNDEGWPSFGVRFGDYIRFERPVEKDRSLYLWATNILSFTDDSTECPIDLLDLYVTEYVTAFAFLNTHEDQFYKQRLNIANGFLADAIEADRPTAEELMVERGDAGYPNAYGQRGRSITNLTNYGSASYLKQPGDSSFWY